MSKLLKEVRKTIGDLQKIESVLTLLESGDVKFTEELMIDLMPIGRKDRYFRNLLIMMELKFGERGCGSNAAARWGVTHTRIAQFNRGNKK